MIPELTATGYLPVGKFACTPKQVYTHFVAPFPSERRQLIFDRWVEYNDRLTNSLSISSLVQWLDGSFVTNKAEPNDLDLVTFVPASQYTDSINWLVEHYSTVNLHELRLDAYLCPVFPENHVDHEEYLYFLNYWQNLFGSSKAINQTKGFLEVTI